MHFGAGCSIISFSHDQLPLCVCTCARLPHACCCSTSSPLMLLQANIFCLAFFLAEVNDGSSEPADPLLSFSLCCRQAACHKWACCLCQGAPDACKQRATSGLAVCAKERLMLVFGKQRATSGLAVCAKEAKAQPQAAALKHTCTTLLLLSICYRQAAVLVGLLSMPRRPLHSCRPTAASCQHGHHIFAVHLLQASSGASGPATTAKEAIAQMQQHCGVLVELADHLRKQPAASK
eukprot:1156138-Pelagomonas_calceolata.AAC.3